MTIDATAPADPAVGHGRGLDASRDAVIMNAALDLVGELGYDNVSMDAIAARARVSKATIYRRWDSKAAVVAQGVQCRVSTELAPLPDTGDLRDDLLQVISMMIARICDEDLALMAGLLTTMRSDPELARLIREQMANKSSESQTLLDRAVERGLLPAETDRHLVDEVMHAVVFSRLIITGEPVDEAFIAHLVDHVLVPVLIHRAHSDNSAVLEGNSLL
jgi:AcrR family transcriptional regulator